MTPLGLLVLLLSPPIEGEPATETAPLPGDPAIAPVEIDAPDPTPVASELEPVADQPEPASAPTPAATPKPELQPLPEPAPKRDQNEQSRTWQAELFVDIVYAFNSNSPDNHILRGMATSPRSNEVTANTIGAFVRHAATDAEPWWFELGFHAGAAVDSLVAAEPVPGGEDGRYAGVEVFKHIALANAGFRIRKTKTSIGAGVFESPLGLSSFWTFRNLNYTPMWQNNIVPYYFMGARISQELPGGVTLSGWIVNGMQTYSDVNKVPSGMVSLLFQPAPRKGMQGLKLQSHVLFGPETVNIAPQDWLILWDTTIAWDFDAHFSMAAAWDLTIEHPGREQSEQNLYTGGGILAKGTIFERPNARIDLTIRPDFLWDRDGRFFGVRQWLITPTATANLWLWGHLLLRLEYRYDHSTAPTGFFYRHEFTGDDDVVGHARNQHTVFMALTGLWDFWFGRRGKDDA